MSFYRRFSADLGNTGLHHLHKTVLFWQLKNEDSKLVSSPMLLIALRAYYEPRL